MVSVAFVVTPAAAVVYVPKGAQVGLSDPAGQYTVTLPQGTGSTVAAAWQT